MKCIILAAGYATRMYPLTENFPKPLLPVAGRSILDRLIDDLSISLIDEFILISNHRFYPHFSEFVKGRTERISILDDGSMTNEGRLGAVLDLLLAIDRFSLDDDLLVIAGDNLLDFSLKSFVDYAIEKKTSCVMRYFEPDRARLSKSGVLLLDSDLVLEMEEKPQSPRSNFCCPPFYFYKREDLPLIRRAVEEGCATDAPGSLVAKICSLTEVNAMPMPGKRYDIGNLESYRSVCETFCR